MTTCRSLFAATPYRGLAMKSMLIGYAILTGLLMLTLNDTEDRFPIPASMFGQQ